MIVRSGRGRDCLFDEGLAELDVDEDEDGGAFVDTEPASEA